MEQATMENLVNCQTLDALAKVWKPAVPDIVKMPKDQARKIIQLKDYMKNQLMRSGQIVRYAKSSILDRTVKIVLDPNTSPSEMDQNEF